MRQCCVKARWCSWKMWNALQVFNFSLSEKESAPLPGSCIWQHWDVRAPWQPDSSHWDFGLPGFLLLMVITLAWFYCMPACTPMYSSYNGGINGGVWRGRFLLSVRSCEGDFAACFRSMPSTVKHLVIPQIRWRWRTHSPAPGYCRTNKTVDEYCQSLPLALVHRWSEQHSSIMQ